MSEQYKALTRKYRPVTFDDIVSQEHVSSTLKNAIENNRLSHAYLFCGPRGVGKTTMARVLARTINNVGDDVDGEALSRTLNILEVDAASNNKVEDAHRIREAVRIPPQTGRYKIFIIDEVHMLSKSAFNALLKTLEEPPAHAIFIFATTEPHKVLPTILSRVQRFDFKPIQVLEIVERLRVICSKESIKIDDESLHIIARKAEGALRDALGLLDQVVAFCGTDIDYKTLQQALNVVSTDRLFSLMEHIRDKASNEGIKLVHDLLQDGHDIQEFLMALSEHLRNLLLAQDKRNLFAIETSEEVKKRLQESTSHFTEEDLLRMLHIVQDAQFKIRDAHQPRILLELTVLKLIKMERSEGLKTLLNQIEELKKKFSNLKSVKSPATDSDKEETEAPATARDERKPFRPQPVSSGQTAPAKKTEDSSENRGNRPAPAAFDGLIGKPSIAGKRPVNRLKSVRESGFNKADENEPPQTGRTYDMDGNLALAPRTDSADDETDSGEDSDDTSNYTTELQDVKAAWSSFLDSLNNRVPYRVCIAMQNTEPVDIRRGNLVLNCNDSLTISLIDAHRQELCSRLSEAVGTRLGMHCVEKETKPDDTGADPYYTFKKMLEDDPHLKTIVDVLGADLDY